MIRAIYEKATASVRVGKAVGTNIFSEPFSVDRGVIQGDKVSPMCFILALQLLRKLHDVRSRGVAEANPANPEKVDCLESADLDESEVTLWLFLDLSTWSKTAPGDSIYSPREPCWMLTWRYPSRRQK